MPEIEEIIDIFYIEKAVKNTTWRNEWEFMRENKRFLSKTKLLLFIILLSSFFIGQMASAEGDGSGGGTGGGTGGGKSQPLTLESSTIKDGATGVSLKPEITLTFSKNIVNMTVNENNKNCFSLQTSNGTNIPINLTLPDDQIDFEKRNDAIITPKANLSQGTTYSIVISSSLKAKSGVTTGKEIKITFTTEVEKPATNNNDTSKPTPKPETAAPKGEITTKPGTVVAKDPNTSKPENKSNPNPTSKVDEKPSTDQNTTDSQTKTADNNTTVEQQPNVDKNENETAVSDEPTEKATPYEAVTAPKTKTDETPSSHNNTYIFVIVISVFVIIAAIISYFYIRKKQAK